MLLKIVGGVAIVAAATAAAIVLNLALLGYAQPRNDPVGKLSPRAVPVPASVPAVPSPPAVTTPGDGEHDD
jgi:hypothetical protein